MTGREERRLFLTLAGFTAAFVVVCVGLGFAAGYLYGAAQ